MCYRVLALPHTFDEACSRIRAALAARPPRPLAVDGFRRASVLIPLLNRSEGPTVLFTQRTETVHEHKGQISFPGGREEPGESPRETALREAHEEVGLEPPRVEILGALDDQPSVSSYIVAAIAGAIADPPRAFVRQETEVLLPFEVPLARLLDRSHFRFEWWDAARMPPGSPVEKLMTLRESFEDVDPVTNRYQVYFFDGGNGREIWGLTARILKQFLDVTFGFSG